MNKQKKTKKASKKTIKFGLYQIYRPRAKAEFRYSPPMLGYNDEQILADLMELSKTQPELQNCYVYHIGTFYPTSGEVKVSCGVRRLVQPKVTIEKVEHDVL